MTARLKQDQSRLQAVVDTAVDGVIVIDAYGTVLMFNPACERLFGYRAEDVLGQNVKMLMPEPYQSGHDSYLRNYRESGERKIIGIGREVLGRKQSGATFPMDLSVGEAFEDGQPIFVGIIRDLTERKAAEKALRESAERMRAVVETAVDGVILIDAFGNILVFNPACERLFGYKAREVIGQNVRMLMPSPYREEHDGYIANYRKTGEARIIGLGREVSGQRKDGAIFPMDLSVGEARQEGESIFVGIIHDLSARKRTEEQLVQAQKMETVGQLSGGIAHDFNNLLTVILGNAEALALRLKAREDLRHLADNIANAAERGAQLTQRLLAFSRRQILQPTAVDCSALVANMQVLLRRTLREDIDLRVSAATPMFALADAAQLESAILNLALNAQDAMPMGGVLALTTEAIELDAESLGQNIDVRPGRYVCICVTDDGTGMSADTIARVFEPFFTTKDVGKGSGLGLSMVYGFAKQSNGQVTIYSELGLGTTVRLYLPVANSSAHAMEQRASDAAPPPGGEETVLVVEDDPFVRSHVTATLESLGYRATLAADGREALAALRAGARPALLFTDIVMPGGVNGWQLVDEARRIVPELKVLFTSGYPLEALASRGRVDPDALILTKPYRKAELARRLREALER
jgi:PAS domain S-box-containing protein